MGGQKGIKRIEKKAGTPAVQEIEVKSKTLVPRARRDSLLAWFELYMTVEAGDPDSNTFIAKRRDLQEFFTYFQRASGTDHPDQWTKSLTEGFLKYLSRDREPPLAATSINRVLATIKHAASWIERQRPFLAGHPCRRVHEFTVEDPEWRGLEDLEINRLKSAAEQLIEINTRKTQQPVRDFAILLVLLHTALRVSELLSLDLSQYKGKYLVNIRRKGKKVTREMLVAKPAREALDRYLDEIRGRAPGPLIQSKTGRRMSPQNVDKALKRIAAQANATLPAGERIRLSAHMLRHTALRKAAERDIRHAMKLSGHTSSKYIWRYTEPSKAEHEKVLEELY